MARTAQVRVRTAGDRLRPGDRKYSKGWTIGAWFIPFANVVLPRRVMTEIERIAIAPREGGRVTQGWRTTRTAVVGWAWWLLSIGGVVFGQIADSMLDGAFETFDMDTAITAYETMAFAAGVPRSGWRVPSRWWARSASGCRPSRSRRRTGR